jgi:Zn finger protein HypA/HybF involved in hydrogenase expression
METEEKRPNRLPRLRVKTCESCDEEFVLEKYNVRICKECYIKKNTLPKGKCVIILDSP